VWTESSDLRITWSGNAYTDAYKALDALGDYVEKHSTMFESVDHVALFSGSVRSSLLQQSIAKLSRHPKTLALFVAVCAPVRRNIQVLVVKFNLNFYRE